MAYATGMRRTRGGLSGLLLILLGAWGALVPFVGPYFHFAYTPDRAWAYTSGRLWLEVAPGVVTVLGGLIVVGTRSRLWGGIGAFLAALAGAWFVVGAAVTAQFVKSGSVSPGLPVGTSAGAAASSLRQFLEGVGFFTGTGVLIVFFAALALGRFSVAGGPADEAADSDLASGLAGGGLIGGEAPPAGQASQTQPWAAHEAPPAGQASQTQPWAAREAPPAGPDKLPAEQGQYPTTTGQYPPGGSQPSPAGQVPPRQEPLGQRQVPPSTAQFPSSSASGHSPSSPPEAGQREEA